MYDHMSRIFIVDDSKIFRFTVVKLFDISGYTGELVEFESGSELIEFLNENKHNADVLPNLILLDINMPHLSGFDTLEELKTLGVPLNNLPVYILSSSIDKEDVEKAHSFPQVEGFITKPLSPMVVKNLLSSLDLAA